MLHHLLSILRQITRVTMKRICSNSSHYHTKDFLPFQNRTSEYLQLYRNSCSFLKKKKRKKKQRAHLDVSFVEYDHPRDIHIT